MYLTDEKTKHSSWIGSYQTRKWNDVTSIIYFEKIYGGRSLLKRIKLEAENTGFKFNSSMIQENETHSWLSSGWNAAEKLNVLSINLRSLELKKIEPSHFENFTKNNIDELVDLDRSIFSSYWQNSRAAFIETLDSCNQNFLFKEYSGDSLVGYAILGATRNFSFLQRFGISTEYQHNGHGSKLLNSVLSFAKEKKYINIRLNTQEDNEAAKGLYTKHGFKFTKTNFIILSTS